MLQLPKNCKVCGIKITIHNWVLEQGYRQRAECIICYKRRKNNTAEKYRKRKDIRTRTTEWTLKHKFGIDYAGYNQLLDQQNNVCAICKRKCSTGRNLAVDHDHNTKIVRGLLCYKCNTAIGYLYEDEDIIWNMLEYLKKHKWSKIA